MQEGSVTASAGDDGREFLLIGELAKKTGTSCSTIRFYEREGLVTPQRHGHFRVYLANDVKRLEFVLAMRAFGLPLKSVYRLVGQVSETGGWRDSAPVIEALKQHRTDLIQQRDAIDSQLQSIDAWLARDGEPSE